VGYNPWCGQSSALDISSICARYGGGGHSVVGGVSLPEGERSRAQMIATTIAQELDAG
jgi:nanoRNase/pAp phosphatase (c-di-AMP/oligoRNAs hydrolase)